MIDYGTAPAVNEVEVCIFGPGYGEAIAVHLGNRRWLLVDSCMDPYSREPAAWTYLNSLGLADSEVLAIIASHWHDDHVRGISLISEKFPKADFFLPSVFNNKEALEFLCAYNGKTAPGQGLGAQQLHDVLVRLRDSKRKPHFTTQRTSVIDDTSAGYRVAAWALSPTPGACEKALAHLASYVPVPNGVMPINHAPELSPNYEAIALHVNVGGEIILLGADLEEHPEIGWSAITADEWCLSRGKSAVYKVAHHGSETACIPDIWKQLLADSPISCLTPFNKGRKKLPAQSDINRIYSYTSRAYISSNKSKSPALGREVVKELNGICRNISRANSGFGAIRLRKTIGTDQEWRVELFGHANTL